MQKLLRRQKLEGYYDAIRQATGDSNSYHALARLSVVDLVDQCGLEYEVARALRSAAVVKTSAWASWKRRSSARFGGRGSVNSSDTDDDYHGGVDDVGDRNLDENEEDRCENDNEDATKASGRAGFSRHTSATVDSRGTRRRQSMIGRLIYGRKSTALLSILVHLTDLINFLI